MPQLAFSANKDLLQSDGQVSQRSAREKAVDISDAVIAQYKIDSTKSRPTSSSRSKYSKSQVSEARDVSAEEQRESRATLRGSERREVTTRQIPETSGATDLDASATVLPESKKTDFFEFSGHNSDENARMSVTDRSDRSVVENPQNATHSEQDEH